MKKKNQKLLFICSSTKTLDELELFFDSDHQSVQALKADILNHKKIPFFRDFKFSKSLKPNDWEKYCYDCYKIPNTDLLYALVSNTSDYKY